MSTTKSPDAHLRDLGARLAALRLSRDLPQASLAQAAGVATRSVKRLEAGESVSLDTFVRILTALDLADHLSALLPDPTVRPAERVRLAGRERQRARGKTAAPDATTWAWGEEDET
jgi:transcriptional regulator with XRE-family HTH domain